MASACETVSTELTTCRTSSVCGRRRRRLSIHGLADLLLQVAVLFAQLFHHVLQVQSTLVLVLQQLLPPQALLLSHLHKVPASLHTFTKSPQVYTYCVTHRETSLALEPSSQSPHKSTHIHNVPTSLHTLCHTQAYCIALYFNSILLYCVCTFRLTTFLINEYCYCYCYYYYYGNAWQSPAVICQAHCTPHAHYTCRQTLPSPVIKSTCLLRVRHYLQRGRSISPILWGCCNANAKC